jgi:hypothetical protein
LNSQFNPEQEDEEVILDLMLVLKRKESWWKFWGKPGVVHKLD